MNNIGVIYLDKNDFTKALSYEKSALALAEELGYPKDISVNANVLSEIYKAQNKWQDAFKMQKLYFLMRDSINNETTRKASLKQQFQYEYEKKETALKDEQEKERAVAEEKSRRQKIIIWSSIGGLLLVVIFTGFIFRSWRITRNKNRLLRSKTEKPSFRKKLSKKKTKT